jgi:hypothetical protein
MKRRVEAVMSKFTDMIGPQTNKAPALTAWLRQARGAVVNAEFKPTGASAINTRASLTSTQSGLSDALKLASSLSLGPPIKSSNGADNEHSGIRKTDSNHRRIDGRAFDTLRLASL